jgi:hypothetical protein
MKALTLHHPWAFAILHLGKDIENRDWTPDVCRLNGLDKLLGETIAIHGGRPPKFGNNLEWFALEDQVDGLVWEIAGADEVIWTRFQAWTAQLGRRPLFTDFITPGVVAIATLTHAGHGSRSPWAVPGSLHLMLSDVLPLAEPVQCRGAQGFWDLTDRDEAAVMEQVRLAEHARSTRAVQREKRSLQEVWGMA